MRELICEYCKKEYDIKEVRRVFGDTMWAHRFCSAICVTKASCQEAKNDSQTLSDHLINIVKLFDEIKFVEIDTKDICGQNMAIVSLKEYDELFRYIEENIKRRAI